MDLHSLLTPPSHTATVTGMYSEFQRTARTKQKQHELLMSMTSSMHHSLLQSAILGGIYAIKSSWLEISAEGSGTIITSSPCLLVAD